MCWKAVCDRGQAHRSGSALHGPVREVFLDIVGIVTDYAITAFAGCRASDRCRQTVARAVVVEPSLRILVTR
jgi:hypothetical protein